MYKGREHSKTTRKGSALRSLVRACNDDQSGATIIEYAIVLPLFLTLVMGILEYSIVLYLRGAIEETTRSIARVAITGSQHGGTAPRDEVLSTLLRERLSGLVFNSSNLSITTSTYSNYQNFNVEGSSTTGAIDANDSTGHYGNANEIVRYSIVYEHEFLTPVTALANGFNNSIIITSTVFAKNENF